MAANPELVNAAGGLTKSIESNVLPFFAAEIGLVIIATFLRFVLQKRFKRFRKLSQLISIVFTLLLLGASLLVFRWMFANK